MLPRLDARVILNQKDLMFKSRNKLKQDEEELHLQLQTQKKPVEIWPKMLYINISFLIPIVSCSSGCIVC